ncbi:hypothetical protein [Rossellomorea aquimaris]|uniref:Uncharacterized protein n=1 Tax=Rossellomorea aquimaris TaxID=189382 RepID=A0A5D4UA79_9BACI|nr:hypothetical protein [Rossellomorea aquimaris]TYS84287.1 hypothetical protein FZC80_02050 [Rossellomorea aquimaris]
MADVPLTILLYLFITLKLALGRSAESACASNPITCQLLCMEEIDGLRKNGCINSSANFNESPFFLKGSGYHFVQQTPVRIILLSLNYRRTKGLKTKIK